MHQPNGHMCVYYQVTTWSVCVFICPINTIEGTFSILFYKIIRLDNTDEFTSQILNDCCMSVKIKIEHPYSYFHLQSLKTVFSINVISILFRL